MTSVDHKSGYQHVSLRENCRQYFGIQWRGYYLVYATLPFGFKASCFVYNSMGEMMVSHGRSLGVPSLVYIDESFNGEHTSQTGAVLEGGERPGGYKRAEVAVYVMCELWCRLGYTLSLGNSVLVPTQMLRFLGMHLPIAGGQEGGI